MADILGGLDVTRLLAFPFTHETSRWTASAFMDAIAGATELRAVICGADFTFGYKREGNVAFLQEWGAANGVAVEVVDLLRAGDRISSTRIRTELAAGDVSAARALLSRDYFIDAPVVPGNRMGRQLGFPTANLGTPTEKLIPANGIYSGRVRVDGEWHVAAISVGTRPTFNGEGVIVEAYLLDFDRDIYGATVRCSFADRLRAEERFADVDALVAQMHRDVEQVRTTLI
jgi:riboflavin kinase/FMN adenylyltransferase